MPVQIKAIRDASVKDNRILLVDEKTKWENTGLNDMKATLAKEDISEKRTPVPFRTEKGITWICPVENSLTEWDRNENIRNKGYQYLGYLKNRKVDEIAIEDHSSLTDTVSYFTEGMALGSYYFKKYKTDYKKDEKDFTLFLDEKDLNEEQRVELLNLINSVYKTRDLVNEPLSYLTAVQFSKEIEKMGKDAGFKTEVFHKEKIASLKMGGLLAVSLGSIHPPTFNILEWSPKNAKNKKPIILVGKGVVFDTGGLSLKPTFRSMDFMKADMAGGAAVAGALHAAAKNKLPLHIIGLIPATENRPGENAMAPGDIIKMYDGSTVEVLNTDAEGRLILADALAYAKKYSPELVIDLATLTGASVRAIGTRAIALMGNADEKIKDDLKNSGYNVFERLAEFPFWDDYKEMLKSGIADIQNTGGATSGAITAGKFLEHFVDFPWVHLDIAGAAYLHKEDSYRGIYGTGTGVRLLYDFLKKRSKNE